MAPKLWLAIAMQLVGAGDAVILYTGVERMRLRTFSYAYVGWAQGGGKLSRKAAVAKMRTAVSRQTPILVWRRGPQLWLFGGGNTMW